MLGDIFLKSFKFLRVLYNFWTNLEIFRVKKNIPWNLGKLILKKREIDEFCFEKRVKNLPMG